MYINHINAYTNKIQRYTSMWRKTQIALLIEVVEERITTRLSDLASSSQHESPLHLIQIKITQQCLQRETNNTSFQITKFQPLDL